MKVIAAATVIRGNGACKVYVDGVMNKEIEKMSKQYERTIEALTNELEATKNNETRLLSEKLPMIRACSARRYGLVNDIRESLEMAYAFTWCLGERVRDWFNNKK